MIMLIAECPPPFVIILLMLLNHSFLDNIHFHIYNFIKKTQIHNCMKKRYSNNWYDFLLMVFILSQPMQHLHLVLQSQAQQDPLFHIFMYTDVNLFPIPIQFLFHYVQIFQIYIMFYPIKFPALFHLFFLFYSQI